MPKVALDSISDTVNVTAVPSPSIVISKDKDPYYRIDIKEERSYNNPFLRKILSGYKNRNLRSHVTELYQEMNLGKISYNKTFAISFYKQVEGKPMP